MSGLQQMVNQFLYYPGPLPPDLPPPQWAGGAEEVWIKTGDGVMIHGLWWPHPAGEPVILFLHGNAQEVYSWSLVHQELAPLNYRLLLIDYRGYGKSKGEPTEAGLYLDGQAALQWLQDQGVSASEIVVFGKSLGGGVACEITQGLELKALILESTFSSLGSVAAKLFPIPFVERVLKKSYTSITKIPEMRCPVLIIHGDRDELIPFQEGEKLFNAAPYPKELYIVHGAGHNDVSMTAGAQYIMRIADFLKNPGSR